MFEKKKEKREKRKACEMRCEFCVIRKEKKKQVPSLAIEALFSSP